MDHVQTRTFQQFEECDSDRERFLLNGPMAPSSKFQWAIQKINGPYHKPNGHSLHAYFSFESCATDCHCIFLASFHTHTLQNILFSFK